MIKKIILFSIILTAIGVVKAQETRTVDSQSSFNTALNASSSGDIIEWEDGAYSDVVMEIDVDGVIVQAETPGEVIFNGASRVEIDSDNVTFTGFQFLGGDIVDASNFGSLHVVRINGSNVLFENINIAEYSCDKYLNIDDDSQFAIIRNCNFEHRANDIDQNIVSILISNNQPGFHKVQFCSFKNFDAPDPNSIGDGGVEPIRIGTSTTAAFESRTIVENCYFTECSGDGEIISHKGTEVIYRFNTFDNNPDSELVLRHGDRAVVYGNFFLNGMGGVRIAEATDHVIVNNYFSGLTSRSFFLSNESKTGTLPFETVEDVIVAFNTFVETAEIRLRGGSGTLPAERTVFANNIFDYSNSNGNDDVFDAGDDAEDGVDIPRTDSYIGNIYQGDLGITSRNGLADLDPDLTLNGEGFYEVNASSSNVIDSAEATDFPTLLAIIGDSGENLYDNEILFDILSNPRPALLSSKDIGCQEYTSGSVLELRALESNTGPQYADSFVLSINNVEEFSTNNFNIYPNPVFNNFINFTADLDQDSDVNIEVYDLSGKKIKTLIDAEYSGGRHIIREPFDVQSGLYLLNIKISSGRNTSSSTRKIIVE